MDGDGGRGITVTEPNFSQSLTTFIHTRGFSDHLNMPSSFSSYTVTVTVVISFQAINRQAHCLPSADPF